MAVEKKLGEVVAEICDRLSLNAEFYKSFIDDPESTIKNYTTNYDADEIIQVVKASMDMVKLESIWDSEIQCACSEKVYHIHSGNGGCVQ